MTLFVGVSRIWLGMDRCLGHRTAVFLLLRNWCFYHVRCVTYLCVLKCLILISVFLFLAPKKICPRWKFHRLLKLVVLMVVCCRIACVWVNLLNKLLMLLLQILFEALKCWCHIIHLLFMHIYISLPSLCIYVPFGK